MAAAARYKALDGSRLVWAMRSSACTHLSSCTSGHAPPPVFFMTQNPEFEASHIVPDCIWHHCRPPNNVIYSRFPSFRCTSNATMLSSRQIFMGSRGCRSSPTSWKNKITIPLHLATCIMFLRFHGNQRDFTVLTTKSSPGIIV